MNSMKRFRELVNSWYLRYLTSTELYMVEPWEKATIHVLFGILFVGFWYFNYSIIVNGISTLRDSSQNAEAI